MTKTPLPERTRGPRSLAGGIGLLLAGHVATLAVGFATVILVSRLLDAEALGRWRLAQAVLTYLVVTADMGLTLYAVREIARQPDRVDLFAGPVLAVRLAFGAVLTATAIVIVLLVDAPDEAQLFYILTFLGTLPASLSLLHVVQGRERLGLFAMARLALTALAGLAGLVSLLVTGELVALAVWPLIVGVVVDLWLGWVVTRRLSVQLYAGGGPQWSQLVTAARPFFVAAIAVQLVSNADAIIIGTFRGEAELGLYASAYVLAGQLLFLSGPLASAIYPRLASIHGEGRDVARPLSTITGMLGIVVLPACLGATAASGGIIALLYGDEFSRAGALLAVLLGMPAIGFYNVAVAQALNAAGDQGTVMRVSILAAATSVLLNVVLVPTVGLMGAAITAVVTETVTAIVFTQALRPMAGVAPLVEYARPLLAAIPTALLIWACQVAGVHLVGSAALGIATYVALTLLRPPPALTAARELVWHHGADCDSAIL